MALGPACRSKLFPNPSIPTGDGSPSPNPSIERVEQCARSAAATSQLGARAAAVTGAPGSPRVGRGRGDHRARRPTLASPASGRRREPAGRLVAAVTGKAPDRRAHREWGGD
ncbi:Os01g0775900 [Oryza sativa Japonica Group]|uniref:Os01g0775900 protein n=1 Tax=Oryza sativa subsp. japonica TaxID=39947 RepID=A0A0P0V8Y7_ORYSJ|nr:hypothetical protein DAI22_01g345000 [Oryza sativa Japonica Group]BAS74600.1 Os01g0775900 [Oryza sativa Japonica Group]